MVEALHTIGVYGWESEHFFDELLSRQIDLVVDVRARRSVRGSRYAFANHKRLEAELDRVGIAYLHVPALAPDRDLRARQSSADKSAGIAKRQRPTLAREFVDSYRLDVIGQAPMKAIVDHIDGLGARPALLCVELEPAACHRSLAASAIADITDVELHHLIP